MSKKGKVPKVPNYVGRGKTPRFGKEPALPKVLVWSFHGFDEHVWDKEEHDFPDIVAKLRGIERRPVAELVADTSHFHQVAVADICKEGQNRLNELRRDDIDPLYSLRLDAKKRLWGVFDSSAGVLRILWWDPTHKVCPSPLRHT